MARRDRIASLGEFIETCTTQHGFRLLKSETHGPRGREVNDYLVRTNGHVLECVLPRLPLDIPMPASILASLCNQLGLRPSDFGLFIG